MNRSRDPFTAAITSYWSPLMRQYGFHPYSIPNPHIIGVKRRKHRAFARIMGDVFQYFDLSAGDSPFTTGEEFDARYASLLLTRVQQDVYSTAGGSIEPEENDDSLSSDWPADTHDKADQSMMEVQDQAILKAIPWLEATSTAEGLAEVLNNVGENPYAVFELGCCHATLCRIEEAVVSLRNAAALFKTPHSRSCFGSAADREGKCVDELLAAIEKGDCKTLLTRWRVSTVNNLNLSALPGAIVNPS